MLHSLKKRLYFVVATYFAFWAKFVLRRWKPRVIVVTGSSGKTTLLHLLEAQLGDKAVYSHHANSAIGIPFNLLGMEPNVGSKPRWLAYLVLAPLHAWRKAPIAKFYVVEADTDRPWEGAFIARLLKPEVTLWVSVYRTHSMNFDHLVKDGTFASHEAAIAYDFGNFAAAATKLVIANGDQPALTHELKRVKADVNVKQVSGKAITNYQVGQSDTIFTIDSQTIHVPGLHPKDAGLALQMVDQLLSYLGLPLDSNYTKLQLPPGRSNVLKGKKGVTLIDSTYNTGLGATKAVLGLFSAYPSQHKWLVIGDILEQGSVEQEEHERLATELAAFNCDQIILTGKRTKKYTLPLLQNQTKVPVVALEKPKEVLDYLKSHLTGNETVLFKGAQGLEGVIEQLLANPSDAKLLVRRETAWVKRRQAWGLPR